MQSLEQFIAMRPTIEQAIKKVCKQNAFAPILALNEALNNALTHGKGAEDVAVCITIRVWSGRLLAIRIADTGPGFTNCPGSCDILDVWAEGGRGRFLMETMMDKVIYDRLGNNVLMIKKLER